MTESTHRLIPALALAIALTGCATGAALRSGQTAETLQDYDRAVIEYTKVLQKKPDSRDARQGLERSKVRAAQDHFLRGRRHEAVGRLDDALAEFQIASELTPFNTEVENALRDVRNQLRTKVAVSREDKTRLESLIERSKSLAPLGLELPDVQLPNTITFPGAGARDIYSALAKIANVSIAFDPQFRDQTISINLAGSKFEDALKAVSNVTRNFYRVTAPRTITIIPDTPAKRREYEEEVVRVFYLSNADLKETSDLLRVVIDARRVSTTSANNAITIRDTAERIAAAGRIIAAIDKARPEVMIDIELLEFDRTRLRELGLQLSSSGGLGLDGSVTIPTELDLRQLRSLGQGSVLFGGLPGIYYRAMKTEGSARTLANTQLRTTEGISTQANFGDRVPVPVTTFAQIGTGSIPQQPITSYNYQNIGVNIDITPRTHHDDAVSLSVKLQVSSISGEGFGGLPTFGNREFISVIRLFDGETNMLAGLIRDDERRSLAGVPGLSDIPILGKLFARTRKESQETDIVLTLTPRIIRVLELGEDDVRPFRLGRDGDSGSSGIIELPLPPALPPRDPGQAPQGAPPPAGPPTGPPATPGPILPPTGR